MQPISNLQAALLFCGTIVASVLGLLGVLSMRTAPLQASANDALRLLMEELQNLHAQDIARISELENEITELKGDNRNLRQKIMSLIELARRAGITVPEDHHVD